MRKLLLALALVLSGAAAEAQIVTPPSFSGGAIPNPICVPDGTQAAPAITTCSDTTTGWFYGPGILNPTDDLWKFSAENFTFLEFGEASSLEYPLRIYNDNQLQENGQAFQFYARDSQNQFNIYGLNDGTGTHYALQVAGVNLGTNAYNYWFLGTPAEDATAGTEYAGVYLRSNGTTQPQITFLPNNAALGNPPSGGNYITLRPGAEPVGANNLSIPSLSGTLLVGGATNSITGPTIINNTGGLYLSDTTADANLIGATTAYVTAGAAAHAGVTVGPTSILIDSDEEASGDGTVIIRAEANTQTVTLGTNAVLLQSDAEISNYVASGGGDINQVDLLTTGVTVSSDDGGGNVSELTVTAPGVSVISTDGSATGTIATDPISLLTYFRMDDGTDRSDVNIGSNEILLDADQDDDADGTVTLSTDNSGQTVVLDSDSVDITSNAGITITAAAGADSVMIDMLNFLGYMTTTATDGTDSSAIDQGYGGISIDGDSDMNGSGFVLIDGGGNETVEVNSDDNATTIAGGVIRMNGPVAYSQNSITIPDSGGAGAATYNLDPTYNSYDITCNDADGCDITLLETSSNWGQVLLLFCLSASPNTCNFNDTAGVSEMAGDFDMDQYDSLSFNYVFSGGGSRWIEVSRSVN